MQNILSQAEALREMPERDKPRKVMELLRSNVHYAYNDVVEELNKSNPELAKWVSENTGLESDTSKPVKLSEIMGSGYGICRHLAVALLVLGNAAGLEGAVQNYAGLHTTGEINPKYAIKNVMRKDNNQPLFKSSAVGEYVYEGHAWVEFKTQDGWIPVDPTPQLVGDTPEGMDTFRDANYISTVWPSFDINGFVENLDNSNWLDLWFLPGESRHTGLLEVNSREKTKPIVIGNKEKEAEYDRQTWPQPTEYEGPLNLQISSSSPHRGMTVGIADVKVA